MHRAIKRTIRMLEKQIEIQKGYETIIQKVQLMVDKLDQFDLELDTGLGFGMVEGVLIKIHTNTMEDVKEVLKEMALAGFKRESDVEDTQELSRRIYQYKNSIKLMVFFLSGLGKKSCRFVEVGKKEVPVYELKCEE